MTGAAPMAWTAAAHLAQLQAAWPEWHISEVDGGGYMATLRASPADQMITTHLVTLENLLFDWEKTQRS